MARFDGGPDRRALNVLLAALEIEQRELAQLTGYSSGYVANVLNGLTPVSPAFRGAFGEALAEVLLGGCDAAVERYPAAPLVQLIRRRAEETPCKAEFYDDLGVTPHAIAGRQTLPGPIVDRICCALGTHPAAVYGPNGEVDEA